MKLKYLGHSANDLYWFILPLILPGLLSKFNLTYGKAGGILTIYLAITAIGSFFMGKLSDRIARKELLGIGFFIASCGFIAAGFTSSLIIFLIIISFTAIGVSTFHPTMYAILDETVLEGKKGQTLGIYETFGSAAILIMFLINGFLLSSIGIKGVLILTAVPGLIMGTIYLRSDSFQNVTKSHDDREQPIEEVNSNYSDLILFLFSVVTRVLTFTAVMNFLPVIFEKYIGFEGEKAVYSTALFFAGGIVGSLTVGKIAERYNSYKILIICSICIFLSILLIRWELPAYSYLPIVFLFGAFGSACFINQNLVLTRLSANLGKGELFGILMGVMTITSSISPAIFGSFLDMWGFSRALFLITIPVLFSILSLLILLIKEDKVLDLP